MEHLNRGSVDDLVRYRIETAKSDLLSANILLKEREYRGANNRANDPVYRAEEIRHASDYDDFYIATKEKAEEQIATAKELIEQVETYCLSRQC